MIERLEVVAAAARRDLAARDAEAARQHPDYRPGQFDTPGAAALRAALALRERPGVA